MIAGLLALIAATGGVVYLHRQIAQTEQLEAKRRARKLAAVRAAGPLALSAIGEYAKECAAALKQLRRQCGDGPGLHGGQTDLPAVPALPTEVITVFSEFIEYSEGNDADLIEELMRDIQVMQSRMRGLISDLANPEVSLSKGFIVDNMIHAGSIYAQGAAAFEFFRRMSEKLPAAVTWNDVKSALRNMEVDENRYPDTFAEIDRLSERSPGPARWVERKSIQQGSPSAAPQCAPT